MTKRLSANILSAALPGPYKKNLDGVSIVFSTPRKCSSAFGVRNIIMTIESRSWQTKVFKNHMERSGKCNGKQKNLGYNRVGKSGEHWEQAP